MAGNIRYLFHQHDEAGNRVQLTHQDGAAFGYHYDPLGRVTTVLDNPAFTGADDLVVRYLYNGAGNRYAVVRGAGAAGFISVYWRDPVERPVVVANDLPGAGDDASIWLAWNAAGQIVERRIENDAYASPPTLDVGRAYQVNGLNQYTGAAEGGVPSRSYDYDASGNLIRAVDPAGVQTTAFLYDVENRLVAASGARTATLVYDPLGRLFEVTGANGAKTQFLYDGDDLVAEYDGFNNLLRRYVHGPGGDDPVAVYEGAGLGLATRRYMLPDERGSIVALVNANGTPSVINRYDAWGVPGPNNEGRFRYTGQIWIPELRLYYYKARFYSPTLGRFLQTDPIGYGGGMNLYAYVGNDPMNYSDPPGLGRVCTSQTPTGSKIAQERCVDVDGNRNGNSREDDISPKEANRIRRSFGSYIQRFGVPGNGRVPDLAPYQKPIGGNGTAAAKNMVSVISQFYGYFATRSVVAPAWNNIQRIDVNSGPSRSAPAPAWLSPDHSVITFSGQSLSAHPITEFYSESYSEVARIPIHEPLHGLGRWNHRSLDSTARHILKTLGMDGEGCSATNQFPGC